MNKKLTKEIDKIINAEEAKIHKKEVEKAVIAFFKKSFIYKHFSHKK